MILCALYVCLLQRTCIYECSIHVWSVGDVGSSRCVCHLVDDHFVPKPEGIRL